jgi:hypothetical protein
VKFEQSHLGICVSNLERSLTFYRDGLGFQDGPSFEINYPISEMSGDVRLISKFLHSGDLRIELLAFKMPTPTGWCASAARSSKARGPHRKTPFISSSWPIRTARGSN